MRTLNQSITEYLKLGARPRTFVRVVDDTTGAEILLAGTKAHGDYEDRLDGGAMITRSIDPVGGMSVVSGCTIRDIILDERLTLCDEAEIAPLVTGVTSGAGRLLKQGLPGGAYVDSRNATSATDYQTPALVVGRNYSVGSMVYSLYRAPLDFSIPTTLTTCEDAFIALTGMGLSPAASFTLYGVAGTWTGAIGTGTYNDFTGWASSGAYPATNLLESWTTAEYPSTSSETVHLRLNAAGRAAIVAAAGGTFRLMLLSDKDVTNAVAPSGAEYVQFEASTARLNLRYNTKSLDNQKAEIYLALEPVPTDHTGMDLIWTGVVDDHERNDEHLTLVLAQNDHKKDCLVPNKIITTKEWPDCPQENIGKGYPVVYGEFYPTLYGEHRDGIGRDNPAYPGPVGALGVRDYVSSLVVKKYGGTYAQPGQILIANGSINNLYDSVPALWNGTRKTFERYWASIGAALTAANGGVYAEYVPALRTVHLAAGTVLGNEEYIGRAFSVIPSRIVRQDAIDPEMAYSGVTGQYAVLDGTNAYFECGFDQQGSFSERERVEVVFELTQTGTGTLAVSLREQDVELSDASGADGESVDFDFLGTTISQFISASADFNAAGIVEDDLLVIASGDNAGEWPVWAVAHDSTLTMKWHMQVDTGQSYKIIKRGSEIYNTTGIISVTGQKCIPLADFTEEPMKYVLRFDQTAGTGSFQIKNLQVRIFCSESEKPDRIYLDEKGKSYGSWITGRGETSGYLIENCAHVIESLGRDEMGLVTAEINTAAFDTAKIAGGAAVFAFQQVERKRARELLKDLGKQARLSVWWDEADRLKVWQFDGTKHFPHSGTDVPGLLDIFDSTGTPANGVCTTHPLLGPVRMYRMGPDEVKNDFVLKYAVNYATGEYSKVLTVNKDGHNVDLAYGDGAALQALCLESYNSIRTVNTLEFEAWGIRDDQTAVLLLTHLVNRLYKRRWKLDIPADIDAVEFEETDYINVRDDRIYEEFGDAVTEIKKWMITDDDVDLGNYEWGLTAIEV